MSQNNSELFIYDILYRLIRQMSCPHFVEGKCKVISNIPPKGFIEEYCNSDEDHYGRCPHYVLRQKAENKAFDLRLQTAGSKYTRLAEMNLVSVINGVVRHMMRFIDKCESCKAAQASTALDKGRLCNVHEFYLQKTVYMLQEVHGFNNKSPTPFRPIQHGPVSDEVNRLATRQKPITSWADSKIDAAALEGIEKGMFDQLVIRYVNMPYKQLETLTSVIYEKSAAKPELPGIIEQIKEKYKEQDAFDSEVKLFANPLKKALDGIKGTFETVEPLPVGSSGILIKLKEKHLAGQAGNAIYSVMKFPRPRGGAFRIANLQIIKEEADLLSSLNHDRIVKVIMAGETEYEGLQLPWYIMEFIGPSKDLGGYLQTIKEKGLSLATFTSIITDIASALSYLHQSKIVHCDIKMDNILIKMDNDHPIGMLTDLGYARAKDGDQEEIIAIRFDDANAHPFLKKKLVKSSDPAAVTAKIARKELDFRFDLHALGKTIQSMFAVVDGKIIDSKSQESVETSYDYRYLNLLMARLIYSGAYPTIDDKPNDLPSLNRHFQGLDHDAMRELAYDSSKDMYEDLLKLSGISLESWIPELNPFAPDVISLGAKETRVVLTKRLLRILEHPDFDRLGSISQLGLINFVYPSAKHTRFEHALGTYAHACEYIRSLWYNTNDPLFRSIVRKKDLYSIMLASLLHDLGYYPMAHDLEDCSKWRTSNIKHEIFSCKIISEEMATQIQNDWQLNSEEVNKIICGDTNSIVGKILHSIISGPIDADKLDYLLRDGMHLGLPFPEGIDKQWLLRNLTIAYGESIVPALAVTSKGKVTAESLATVRFDMFTVAYWHHTIRAIKTMLRYAVDRLDAAKKYDENEFYDWVRTLPYVKPNFELVENARKGIMYTDYLLLCWLRDKLDSEGKVMIDMILQRKLFKRILVLDSTKEDTQAIHTHLIKAQDSDIERMRIDLESKIRDVLVGTSIKNIADIKPLVLIDVPRSQADPNPLYAVTEMGCNPMSQNSVVWKELVEKFSQTVESVRVFVHPDIVHTLESALPNKELVKMLQQVVQSPRGYRRQ